MFSDDVVLLKEQIRMLNTQVDSLIKQRDSFASMIGEIIKLCKASDKRSL